MQSDLVEWVCKTGPCPWGSVVINHAIGWPVSAKPVTRRLGYRTSVGIYIPAALADGVTISILSGAARVYAGLPETVLHRVLTNVTPGQSYSIAGLLPGEIVSVQSDSAFAYVATPPDSSDAAVPGDSGVPEDPFAPTDSGALEGYADAGDVVQSVVAIFLCDGSGGCTGADRVASVISWPWWSAEQNDGGSVDSRSAYSPSGGPLYPYMRSWADGCVVTAHSETVSVIQGEYGNDVWREARLEPGQSHVIDLAPPENGAMIQSDEGSQGFTVSLDDCTPRAALDGGEP